jgi:hypothetical protein
VLNQRSHPRQPFCTVIVRRAGVVTVVATSHQVPERKFLAVLLPPVVDDGPAAIMGQLALKSVENCL